MPWTDDHYPASMRHLTEPVRRKAIEIANALLGEGVDEGRAIRIAIAQARRWAQRRRLPPMADALLPRIEQPRAAGTAGGPIRS